MCRVVAVASLLVVSGFRGTMMLPPTSLLAQEQPKQQEVFTPVDQLPPQDQLPAAPLLIGAYAFVLLMLFGYMFMVSRRLSVIQREVDRLDSDLKRSGRS
jgi:CcmD family protein